MKPQEDMSWGRAVLSLLEVALFLGTIMMVLEQLPIQALPIVLITMFVVGFAIPQKKCQKCDMTQLSHEERVKEGIEGLE